MRCALALIMCEVKTQKTQVISIARPEWWNESERRGSLVAYTLLVKRAGYVLSTFALLVLLMK